MIVFWSCLNGLLSLWIPSPVRLMTSHSRYPVCVIILMCFNFISRMTLPGIKFYLIPCLLINICCSSQLNLDILVSFLLSTLGVLGRILRSKWKFIGKIPPMIQLPTLSSRTYMHHCDTRQYSSNFQFWELRTPFESRWETFDGSKNDAFLFRRQV